MNIAGDRVQTLDNLSYSSNDFWSGCLANIIFCREYESDLQSNV